MAQPVEGERGIVIATEEERSVVHAIRTQPEIRTALVGPAHRGGLGSVEARVLAEDGALELDELGTRVEAELVGQNVAGGGDRTQRIALATGAVPGQREQCPSPFPQRLFRREPLGVSHDLAMLPQRQTALDEIFLCLTPLLVQVGDVGRAL